MSAEPVSTPVEPAAASEGAAGEPAPSDAEPIVTAEPAEPKIVQIWRPQRAGNRSDHRGAQRSRGRQNARGGGTGSGPAEQAQGDVTADAVPAESGERQGRPERGKGRPNRDFSKREFSDRRADKGGRGPDEKGGTRRFEKSDHGGARNGGSKPGGNGSYGGGQGKPAPSRPQRIDPDSPFAALAALKDKLGK